MDKKHIPKAGDKLIYEGDNFPSETGVVQTVLKVNKNGEKYDIETNVTSFMNISTYYKECVISSDVKLKLEGYRLIKTYPTCKFKLGVLLVENQYDPCCWCLKQDSDSKNQSLFDNLSGCHITPFPEHWDPVYKIVEKTITIGNRNLRITNTGEIIGQYHYRIENWQDLYNHLINATFGMRFKSTDGNIESGEVYAIRVTAVSMGCVHNVSLDDIKLVIDEYYKLNPKTI